jgi:hypothetical protein
MSVDSNGPLFTCLCTKKALSGWDPCSRLKYCNRWLKNMGLYSTACDQQNGRFKPLILGLDEASAC